MKEWLNKKINRSILLPEFICGLFVMLFFTVQLFIFGPAGYRNITIVKYITFLVLSCSFAAAMLAVRFFYGKVSSSPKRGISATELCIILYVLFTLISAVFSEFFPETIVGAHRKEGALTICIYAMIFFFVERNICAGKWFIYLLSVVITLFSLVCILQFFKINALSLFPEGLNYYDGGVKYSGEFLGTLGNAGLTAALLCMTIPILIVYSFNANEKERFGLIIPIIIGASVLIKSKIAAGILGFVAGMFLIFPFVVGSSKKTRRVLWLFELLVFAGFLVVVYFCEFDNRTLSEFHGVLHGNFEDSYGSSRIFIWKHALPLIPERPILGGGADTLADRIGVIFETVKDDGTVRKASIDAAHNEYLNIAVCQGVPAFIAYASALISTFVKFVKSESKKSAAAAFAAGMMCYCVQAFFGISVFICTPYFWIIWGLLEGSLRNIDY